MSKDFNALFLAHRRELHAYINKKLQDPAAADDLAQETFLRFVEFKAQNPTVVITEERSYLYRIAHNLAIDHLRREHQEPFDPMDEDEISEIEDPGPRPEQTVSNLAELSRVRDTLLELPERTRQIYVLSRIEGLTYEQVADRLGISTSSVQKHLAQATRYVMLRLRRDDQ